MMMTLSWCACFLMSSAAAELSGEGYLFVTNRPDEASAAARRIRTVSRHANITLICDAASRDEVYSEGVFDVVLSAEAVWPDLDVHDSMGFRLQKLRGMMASPYKRTIYMDSDTLVCRPIDDVFRLFDDERTDVACVWGGRKNHTGASAGILAYRASAASSRLWEFWLEHYSKIMDWARREQPSFQKAMHDAQRRGLVVHRLPMTHNCRNVRNCGPVRLKDGGDVQGCKVIHAHDFDADLQLPDMSEVPGLLPDETTPQQPPPASHQPPSTTRPCTLSGAHRLVVYVEPPHTRRKKISTVMGHIDGALAKLKLDNDFSVCAVHHATNVPLAVKKCVAESNKYAVVVLGNLDATTLRMGAPASKHTWPPTLIAAARHPADRAAAELATLTTKERDALDACLATEPSSDDHLALLAELETADPAAVILKLGALQLRRPSCFERQLNIRDNADTRWFCGAACDTLPPENLLDGALSVVRTRFSLVGLADAEATLVSELERLLPSHFLKLSRFSQESDPERGRRRRRQRRIIEDPRVAAFVKANVLDAALYALVGAELRERVAKCDASRNNLISQ